MPHFGELKDATTRLLEWADLRQEQGCDVGGGMERLVRQVRALAARLENAKPPAATAKGEPDGLREILALRPPGPRKCWRRFQPRLYAPRIRGAWLARAAGCTLGAIVEGWAIAQMEQLADYCGVGFPPADYWPAAARPYAKRYGKDICANYTRGGIRYVPVDDDLAYTVLGLLILEEYGPGFTTADVARAWLKYLPTACTAEKVALDNLRAGASWRRAAERGNPYVEWIGADIRSDTWGYAAPGWPELAARMAYRDAYLSHRGNGIYGAMYFSAVIATAFAVDAPLDACRIALTEIPRTCRLYRDVAWALRQCPRLKDFRHARGLVDKRFPGVSSVHTNNNACLTIFGLAIGGCDVAKVIGNTVAMGLDNDCTAATAGSIAGACAGLKALPKHWYRPFRNTTRTYLNGREWLKNSDLARRFAVAAAATWATPPPGGTA